jgi:hypothetical protein
MKAFWCVIIWALCGSACVSSSGDDSPDNGPTVSECKYVCEQASHCGDGTAWEDVWGNINGIQTCDSFCEQMDQSKRACMVAAGSDCAAANPC